MNAAPFSLHDLTNADGDICEPALLAASETVHRQLRPQLPAGYCARMAQICAAGGRMLVAAHQQQILGLAVWRLIENTHEGRKLYVDDLITDEQQRSSGVGAALLSRLEDYARQHECSNLALDSGTQRLRAHAFYFREGMRITSFAFHKPINGN